MPIVKYFLWVGGGLLTLLFIADLYLPKQPARTEVHYTYHIPITSSVRAGLAPVTFSGETRSFGPPPPMTVVDFASRPSQAMQANARMTSPSPSAEQRAEPERKKVAKRKIKRRRAVADRDVAHLPRGWRREEPTGLAFARPFFW